MPKSIAKISEESYQAVIVDPIEWAAGEVKKVPDMFTPELPPAPETPDPVAEKSAIGAAQAEERSLINRAGLATTKKVNYSLLKQRDRQSLGGTVA